MNRVILFKMELLIFKKGALFAGPPRQRDPSLVWTFFCAWGYLVLYNLLLVIYGTIYFLGYCESRSHILLSVEIFHKDLEWPRIKQ